MLAVAGPRIECFNLVELGAADFSPGEVGRRVLVDESRNEVPKEPNTT